jgi:hypothetical protein
MSFAVGLRVVFPVVAVPVPCSASLCPPPQAQHGVDACPGVVVGRELLSENIEADFGTFLSLFRFALKATTSIILLPRPALLHRDLLRPKEACRIMLHTDPQLAGLESLHPSTHAQKKVTVRRAAPGVYDLLPSTWLSWPQSICKARFGPKGVERKEINPSNGERISLAVATNDSFLTMLMISCAVPSCSFVFHVRSFFSFWLIAALAG